ncbi:hypothetical protein JCM3765_003196 [Sporobolomyces pararoseus]
MAESKKVDHLSRLPPELVQDIFDAAHSVEEPLSGPLSRGLHLFYLQTRYRSIQLTAGYRQLSKFCKSLTSEVARYIISLKIKIKYPDDEETEEDLDGYDSDAREFAEERLKEARPTREADDVDGPDDGSIKTMLEMMHNLEILEIAGSTRLSLLVLSPLDANSTFRHLSELSLGSVFTGIEDPFHPTLFRNLSNYSQLNRIELFVERPSNSIVPSSTSPPPLSETPFLNVVAITVSGPLFATSSTSLLISSIPHLSVLNLTDSSLGTTPWRITSLFDSVCDLERIRALALNCICRQTEFEGSFSESLSRCPNLQALALGGPFPNMALTFYETLARLPLVQLVFFLRFPISLDYLKKLVFGPSQSETLQYLNLSNVEAKTIKTADWFEREIFGDAWQTVPPAVVPARWTESFSKDGLHEFLELVTQEEGALTVAGSALEALIKEDIWIPLRYKALASSRGNEGESDEWETETEGDELSLLGADEM